MVWGVYSVDTHCHFNDDIRSSDVTVCAIAGPTGCSGSFFYEVWKIKAQSSWSFSSLLLNSRTPPPLLLKMPMTDRPSVPGV